MIIRNMKPGLKKCWKSFMPLRVGRKSATCFCMFPKVPPDAQTYGKAPVYLNVYDLTPLNGYVYWAGLGIFHSGVEESLCNFKCFKYMLTVHGVEYAFGAHNYSTSGVFEVEPRQCPGFQFRKSIFMGTTCLDPIQIREFMEHHLLNYNGDTYHLIVKNCNHFSKDACYKLTGKTIPKWVNRLAKIGSVCNCLLPEVLRASAACHDPGSAGGEKRRLRSSFSCFSSISIHHRRTSSTSLFLPSLLKGSLTQLELRKWNPIPLEER